MLKVEQIEVSYGNLKTLRKISFEAKESEITVIVGSNGSGKSTTLRAVSGFVAISSGKVFIHDIDITNKPPYQIVDAGISLVDENIKIFPYMTVLENLRLGAYKKKAWIKQTTNFDRVFSLFPRLKERVKQLALTLSGGERRMLGIGRGLMAEPEVLMLDEPSSGLAPNLVMNVFEAIESINRLGTTVLLVEQNVWESLSLGTSGYVIENGVGVMSGPCSTLLGNPEIRSAYLRI